MEQAIARYEDAHDQWRFWASAPPGYWDIHPEAKMLEIVNAPRGARPDEPHQQTAIDCLSELEAYLVEKIRDVNHQLRIGPTFPQLTSSRDTYQEILTLISGEPSLPPREKHD